MTIRSPRNETLKDIRRLRRSKGDHALLEGPHLLAEALRARLEPTTVLMSPDFLATPSGRALQGRLPRPALEVEAPLLASLMDADSPRGVLAVVSLPRPTVFELPPGDLYLYLDHIQDPGNLGALARVAEAAGVAGLALSPGCVHTNHPRALRASAGSLLRLPVAADVGFADLLHRFQAPEAAATWTALVAHGGENLYHTALPRPVLLLLGSEGQGLEPQAEAAAHRRLTIPLAPAVESLNVSTAAAITLFELRRRQRATGNQP
jgi:TrmH family RNA methyltransferase